MLKVIDAVKNVISSDEVAIEAMRSGILNFSAYSELIHKKIENLTFKEVKKTTIVVALSRMAQKIYDVTPLKTQVKFDEISIKSPLVDITFDKTPENIAILRSLIEKISQNKFLTFTEGINELTIIASADQKETILENFKSKPKITIENLVGLSLRFSDNYINEPNVIYSILSLLASKRINLSEVVSTYTELTLVISENDLDKAIKALKVG